MSPNPNTVVELKSFLSRATSAPNSIEWSFLRFMSMKKKKLWLHRKWLLLSKKMADDCVFLGEGS